MTVDCATGDNPDDARWLEANRRLKMLAERAILHGDHHATREIETLLQGQILRLAVSVNEPHLRQEVAANLGAHAFEVIHRKFQQADLLLAYVTTAVRRQFGNELRRIGNLRNEVPLPDWVGETAWAAGPTPEEEVLLRDRHEWCKKLIHELKRSAEERRSRTDLMVASVVEVRYYLSHLTVTGACDLLGFTKNETKTIAEKISRARRSPRSPIHQLAHRVQGEASPACCRQDPTTERDQGAM